MEHGCRKSKRPRLQPAKEGKTVNEQNTLTPRQAARHVTIREGNMKTNSFVSPDDAQFVGRIRAAALLDVNPQTIDKYIRRGQLRAFHIGRKVVVRRDELLRLVEANEV
jgi:excisionase family DNA binding protein